jgi:hypothetical protein
MQPSKKTKALYIALGSVLGGLIGAAFCIAQSLKSAHHYREIETFFRGNVAGKEVLGISYLDYHGVGFMESNQWKILLQDSNGQSIVIYQNRPMFQEGIPHQPHIEIKDTAILIDDGENELKVEVHQ